MRICFLGAGALGCAIGGTLTEAGCDVSVVDRNAAHVDAMSRDGLAFVNGSSEDVVRVRASTRASGLGTMDLVVVLVKSFDTRNAIKGAGDILGPNTVVMSAAERARSRRNHRRGRGTTSRDCREDLRRRRDAGAGSCRPRDQRQAYGHRRTWRRGHGAGPTHRRDVQRRRAAHHGDLQHRRCDVGQAAR